MCRWMGSHFKVRSDYNGVAFSIQILEWGHTFSDFWCKTVLHTKVANVPECLHCRLEVECSSLNMRQMH